jgi:hypothetical protein
VKTPNPLSARSAKSAKKSWSTPRVEILGNLHEVIRQGQGKSGVTPDGGDGQGNMMNMN